jgi:hypothetical protein
VLPDYKFLDIEETGFFSLLNETGNQTGSFFVLEVQGARVCSEVLRAQVPTSKICGAGREIDYPEEL